MDVEVELEDEEGYTPEAYLVDDGSFLIFDHVEFAEIFNCLGIMNIDGQVFVLDKTTNKFKKIEQASQSKLSAV